LDHSAVKVKFELLILKLTTSLITLVGFLPEEEEQGFRFGVWRSTL